MSRHRIVVGIGIVVLMAAAVGAVVWLTLNRGSDDPASAGEAADIAEVRQAATEYADLTVAGDNDGTYRLLSSATRTKIAPEDWRRRNGDALASFGRLEAATVLKSRSLSSDEAVITIEFRYSDAGVISASLRMEREGDEWKVVASVAE